MNNRSHKPPQPSARQSLPEHTRLKEPPGDGSFAHAPYNFVPLPNQVVPAQAVPGHDRYQGNTGWIDCQIETLTPLYVRGMMTTTTFAEYSDVNLSFADLPQKAQQERARFFAIEDRILIPGSSLRGMIRALVEIIAFGKVGPVGAEQRFFYRAVAAPNDDPLAPLYKQQMQAGRVKAGYVERKPGSDGLFIRPALKVNGRDAFIQVKEIAKDGSRTQVVDAAIEYKKLDQSDYTPQYVPVSFSWKMTPNGRAVAERVNKPGKLPYSGWMVCSGNMAESGKGKTRSPRRNHIVVPQPDQSAALIPIRQSAIEDYLAALTDFQREKPFDARNGCLVEGKPVFYIDNGKEVVMFGHTRNFRLPFTRPGQRKASTALDFVPDWLRDEKDTDMAEAMFGYVKSNQVPYGRARAYAGRVFFGDAVAAPGQAKLLQDEITPQILSSPKPSTFQHYLTQPDEAATDRAKLKHYASQTPDETVIRGHKLYWHCKDAKLENFQYQGAAEERQKHKKQLTRIRPVRAGARFTFRVRFENLTDEELGALLWALELPVGCAHKLGMGKPLGLGSARISVLKLTLTDRRQRYAALFADNQWADGALGDAGNSKTHFKSRFEQHMLAAIAPKDRDEAALFAETPRMREMLTMLSYQNAPPRHETRYMTIEPKNEYAERLVLPLPSSVHAVDIRAITQQPIPEPAQVSQPVSTSRSSDAPEPAVLLTAPQNKRARVRLHQSGVELECRGFSSFEQRQPGAVCLVRVFVDQNGTRLRAEFQSWEQ